MLKGTNLLALAALPAMLLGQQGRSSGQTRQHQSQAQQQQQDTVTQAAPGALAPTGSRNLGLTNDQAKELQQAINAAGCNAGRADGEIGPATYAGIACVRRQKNISGNNVNDVLRALGLNFTAPDSLSATAQGRQTQSGVVNPKTGRSTLGPNIKKREPMQGAPVTVKGDTIKKGADTVPKAGTDTSRAKHDTSGHDTSRTGSDTSSY